ncbi:PA2779 family protein [Gayadomonas joobiniege]|uniref:PA2779 family protein n=1 Tax=Gayadomonas joobiniege TaxID=1234606 RepID=UPI00037DF9C0|nr:PA2779 family protein [Gayadomonas joobiniege]
MKNIIKAGVASCLFVFGASQATAGVYESSVVLQNHAQQVQKSQVLSYLGQAEVKQKLIELGVDPQVAQARIGAMTEAELHQLNQHIHEMPAGSGIIGTIFTVMVVVAVLDVMGITDVYPFIRPL